MPRYIPREGWGARRARRRADTLEAEIAVVHHTAGPNTYSASEAAACVRAIQDLHMDVNGWDDIGYNVVIDRFGRAFRAREGVGAHTRGHNSRALGVALLGDFTRAVPAPAALSTLSRVVGALPVVWHSELGDTECPGAGLRHLGRRSGSA